MLQLLTNRTETALGQGFTGTAGLVVERADGVIHMRNLNVFFSAIACGAPFMLHLGIVVDYMRM